MKNEKGDRIYPYGFIYYRKARGDTPEAWVSSVGFVNNHFDATRLAEKDMKEHWGDGYTLHSVTHLGSIARDIEEGDVFMVSAV